MFFCVINYYCQQDVTTSQTKMRGVKKLLLKLRGKRVENGYSQREMAKMLNLSTNAYNLKEIGKREFKMSEINLLLELLHCNYEEIFLPAKSTE